MGTQFAELPRWEFSVVEVAVGTYRVVAVRDGGIRGEATGVDPDRAVAGLREWAAKVEQQLASDDVDEVACPVCGSVELTSTPYATWPPPDGLKLAPPYEDILGQPSYEVCPNCGFEFGNDDNPGTAPPCSFEEYRAEWLAEGAPRFRT